MFVQKILVFTLVIGYILGAGSGDTSAQAQQDRPGSCANQELRDEYFPVNPEGEIDRPSPVKVLRHEAAVFPDERTSEAISDITLEFSKSLMVLDLKDERVQVRTMASLDPLGWVNRADLLCTLIPLKSSSGLEKKLYIRTETQARDERFSLTEHSFNSLRDAQFPDHLLTLLQNIQDIEYHGEEAFTEAIAAKIGSESEFETLLTMLFNHANFQATPVAISAYPAPNLTGCEEDTCRKLSKFTGYFIFDEHEFEDDKQHMKKSYLLSETYRLDETSKLVGWIDNESGIIWNTAYGVRPKEDLVFPEGHEHAGEERPVYAYEEIEDGLTQGKGYPILGGDRWFLYAERIPILDRVEREGEAFYQVAIPLAGVGLQYDETGKLRAVNPTLLAENPGIASLQNRKNVDIAFLFDGTRSIVSYIKLIGEVIQNIQSTLKNDENFKETQFRFGYRFYRDKYAGNLELDQGKSLPPSCVLSEAEQRQQAQDVLTSLDALDDPLPDAGDDFPENLFGGIERAIIDLAPCPDHTKLLIVIGDCGYDREAQRQKGRTPISVSSLVTKLKGSIEDKTTTIATFFLQTPILQPDEFRRQKYSSLHYDSYQKAHASFSEQARTLLNGLLPEQDKLENFSLMATDQELALKILDRVKQFGDSGLVNELILDVRGGASLVEAIERLQKYDTYKNLPGLFWEIVKEGSCQELGAQCSNRVYETIFDGYIPVSEDIVEDVWLKSQDVNLWLLILNNIGSMFAISGSELREQFVHTLVDALEKVIRKPPYQDTGESLAQYLERKGSLPVRNRSPLFRYSLKDLRDDRVVPNCELSRLVIWLSNVTEMLGIIRHGNIRPVFKQIPFPGECPSGEDIPFIDGPISQRDVGSNPNMRFDHTFQKARIFWVPSEYLP